MPSHFLFALDNGAGFVYNYDREKGREDDGTMKRLAFLLLALLLLTAGCGGREIPKIEDHTWQMTTVQSGPQGQPVAYGPQETADPAGGTEMLLVCEAKNGILTLWDQTNGKTYSGTYRLSAMTPRSADYEVEIGASKGRAIAAFTTYYDGSSTPTFIISIDGYALNFSAQAGE